MRDYIVFRDLSRPSTLEPFDLARRAIRLEAVASAPVTPRLEVERLSKAELRDLARDPDVRAIAPPMPTRLIRPKEEAATEAASVAWGISAVGADASARTGAGVTVAVLDTGIDSTHPAFSGVTLTEKDFSGNGNGDVQGHGTHCAGTIFGRDVDGTRIGVARGVDHALIGKVLGDDGSGDSLMLIKGMQWAVDEGAQVISMSLGFDFAGLVKRLVDGGWPVELATSAALEAYRANVRLFDAVMQTIQVREAFGGGTIVLAASGNESQREIDPDFEIGASLPAAAQGIVSVGALQQQTGGLRIADFSNTFPQVCGPGVAITSAKAGGGLRSLSGTSMATPHVAGVTALWWEEVVASTSPHTSQTVLAQLLAHARTDVLDPKIDVADRGAGLITCP